MTTRKILAIVSLALAGCGIVSTEPPTEFTEDEPGHVIETCGLDHNVTDCCTADRQCRDYYGPSFPFCLPGTTDGGLCGACIEDSDCLGGDWCYIDGNGQTFCDAPDTE